MVITKMSVYNAKMQLHKLEPKLPSDRFDFSALKEKNGEKKILEDEQENFIISNLHQILKPFLLRRLKCDGKAFPA